MYPLQTPAQLTAVSAAVSAIAPTFMLIEHMWNIISIALLSLVPSFEGRYAIAMGIAMGIPLGLIFPLAFIMSTVPMILVFLLLKPVLKWLYMLPINSLRRFAAWVENRAQRKSRGMETGSFIALFLFVAVPLPGTGVWTGSIIAALLEMEQKRAALAIIAGNLIACGVMALGALGVTSIIF